MDFQSCVKTCTANPTAGCSWWEQVIAEAKRASCRDEKSADALRLNVERTNLFTQNRTYTTHVVSFCQALDNYPTGSGIWRAIKAINESEVMVCAGPPASRFTSAPCRLIGFESFYRHNSSYGRFDVDLLQRAWDRTTTKGESEYNANVDPARHIRGQLPQSFWAPHGDIVALEGRESVTLGRLRHFLGLHDDFAVGSFDGIGRALLIGLEDSAAITFSVPTGWDGFDNPYFRETLKYDRTDASTYHGATLDRATNGEGAQEIVSKPVPGGRTKLIKCYE